MIDSIFRNSGIIGGKFLERRAVQKTGTSQNYMATDFFVGAVIEVFGHRFVLHDADEYAYNHMEANPSEFPMSDLNAIEDRLRRLINQNHMDIQQTFRHFDLDSNGYISLSEFREGLINLNFDLTEQVSDHHSLSLSSC